ncbi:MAG: hypothetical protein H0T69_14545 [Thermoleophilaceae bacterium]|nr:hypothetical protein [Thermoleophilaceae bacterium]
MTGITISRFDRGRIVEDWSTLDSLEFLRQLGVVNTLLAAPRLLQALREAGAGSGRSAHWLQLRLVGLHRATLVTGGGRARRCS